jgi:hypothetical protein
MLIALVAAIGIPALADVAVEIGARALGADELRDYLHRNAGIGIDRLRARPGAVEADHQLASDRVVSNRRDLR